MKTRFLIAAFGFALAAETVAQDRTKAAEAIFAQGHTKTLEEWSHGRFGPTYSYDEDRGTGGSVPRVLPAGVERGAIYELKLRIRWEKVDEYLSDYARWFLPVDQLPCEATTCESSGRKLITVMTRELGDHYDLVFLYRYESAYKEDYYCKFSKAFFRYHLGESTLDPTFRTYFAQVLRERGLPATFPPTTVLLNLPTQCAKTPTDVQMAALALARDTVHKFDMTLASRVELDEGSWNFDINACKVLKWQQAQADNTVNKATITATMLEDACPTATQSWLDRAVRQWEPK